VDALRDPWNTRTNALVGFSTTSTIFPLLKSFLHWVVFIDIEECEEEKHDCGENAVCVNEKYSFTCECADGYQGDGYVCNGTS
jgi:hypothetical protein